MLGPAMVRHHWRAIPRRWSEGKDEDLRSHAGDAVSNVDVSSLGPDEVQTFVGLYQFYRYDFSEFNDEDVTDDGYFIDDRAETYPTDPRFQTFLIRVDGHVAGFAILQHCDAVDGTGEVTDMEQFFVMRKYRRRGIGRVAAMTLFDRHPGRWQVRERHNNLPAQAFWRAIIERSTGGRFNELAAEQSPTGGPVQFFMSGGT